MTYIESSQGCGELLTNCFKSEPLGCMTAVMKIRWHLVGERSHIGPSLLTEESHCWLGKRLAAVMTPHRVNVALKHSLCIPLLLQLPWAVYVEPHGILYYHLIMPVFRVQSREVHIHTPPHAHRQSLFSLTLWVCFQSGLSICKCISVRNERGGEERMY